MTQNRSQSCVILACALAMTYLAGNADAETFSLDYRYQPDQENLLRYDFSILDLHSQADLTEGHARGKEFYAYISVGEIAGNASYLREVQALNISLPIRNSQWNTYYVDVADPRWAEYVIKVLALGVVERGFDGFFLDTVDAVETLMDSDRKRANAYRLGMVNLIKGLKAAYPTKKIITNRGFVVFQDVKDEIKGVLVEELFQLDDYSTRSSDEVGQLLERIGPIRAAGLPVYILDYVPATDLDSAHRTAAKISSLGFYPAIMTQALDGIVLAPVPRPDSVTVQDNPPETPGTPVILTSPRDTTVVAGSQAAFQVLASGTAPLSFQWFFNGSEISGAIASSFTLQNVQPGSAGRYSVRVSNALGSVVSEEAGLTVLIPPVITSQPQRQTVVAGADVVFDVSISSELPVTYQWRYDGIGMDGASGISLVLTNVQPPDAGRYSVVVSNAAGSIKSAAALLTVSILDSDGDGIPDAWEIANGLNPNDPSDSGLDFDQDGLTNLQEYLRGKDPRNPGVLGPASFCIDFRYAPSTRNFWGYDCIILSPDAEVDLSEGHSFGKKFFAYISVGEIARNAEYFQQAEEAGVAFLSENENWDSLVVDLASPAWSTFVVENLASLAVRKGYDGFFLDTMDSYYLASEASQTEQESGLVYLMKKLKKAYPDKQIIANRGFPVFEQLKNMIDGVLVESLFQRWSFSAEGWESQSQSGTEWLLDQLAPVKAAGLPIFIVDYVDPSRIDIASWTAERIDDLGFSPLIVGKNLDGTVLAPLPKLEALSIKDGAVLLRFKARTGKSYSVQYSDSLIGGQWVKLADIESEAKTRFVELTDGPGSARSGRVYRLVTPKLF
jgi:hypothetical protein